MYKIVKKLTGDSFLVLDTSDGSKDPCTAKEIYDLLQQGYQIEGATVEGKELVIRISDDAENTPVDGNANDDNCTVEDDDDNDGNSDDDDDEDVEYVDDDEEYVEDEEYVDDED